MKKIITFSIICILGGIVLSSCKSGVSITKRHYTKGYHIARNHSVKPINSITVKTKETPSDIEKITVTNKLQVLPWSEELQFQKNQIATLSDKTLIAVKNNKLSNKEFHKKENTNLFVLPKMKLIKNDFKFVNNTKNKESKIGSADHTHDGLSLFWLVILVIVILWALGVIAGGFGLGGLIHLLLVVALILLILWLLRII